MPNFQPPRYFDGSSDDGGYESSDDIIYHIYNNNDRPRTCLAGCVNPARGLHHRSCPNHASNRSQNVIHGEEVEEEEAEEVGKPPLPPPTRRKTYFMAVGDHWWSYVVDFNLYSRDQDYVYIENSTGMHRQDDDKFLFVSGCGNRLFLGTEGPGAGWTELEN